jgi:hypothetical protein
LSYETVLQSTIENFVFVDESEKRREIEFVEKD